ncbi:beta-galactosidase [Pontiellaceae bacterium B12227]|nr:beta-galactosidase [Pontiellaceae bacterium B12227]
MNSKPWKMVPFSALLLASGAAAWDGGTTPADWQALANSVSSNETVLATLVAEADAAGLNTDYAYVSQVVIDRFQTFAQYDYDHPEVMSNAVEDTWWGHKIPNAATYHLELPFDEMAECLAVASNAVAELQAQLASDIVLKAPLDLSSGTMTLTNDYYALDGIPAIPSTFTWMPADEDLMQAFGRMSGSYYQLTNLEPDGSITPWFLTDERDDAFAQTANNEMPQQIFLGGAVDSWMIATNSAITNGARNFVKYDTDSPQIRNWLTQLFEGLLPELCGPNGSGNGARMHLLANEPNFATRKGGWLADNGVSANTMTNYNQWLQDKYTAIANLNTTYGTTHADFNAAMNAMTMPIDPSAPSTIQGGPVWHDWCLFNMSRINGFFEFLKAGTQANDPGLDPVTIKVLGRQFLSSRDEGIDVEYLAKLMDVQGADNKVIPLGMSNLNYKGDEEWMTRYGMQWTGQSATLDFMRSVSPGKAFYDSEWHGLSTGRWRDFSMDPDYVRAAIWMAASHGMRAMQAWYWPRDDDGSLRKGGIDAMMGSIVTLPSALDAYGRTFKELNAHAASVVSLVPETRYYMIYHCDEAAIQDADYLVQLEAVYESAKLLNIPVGFVTPSTFSLLNPAEQTVIMPPAPFVSDANLLKLQAFEAAGGNVIQVNGTSASFAKDEHGVARGSSGLTPYASVPYSSDTFAMAAGLESALLALKPVLPVEVEITDGGAPAYGVLAMQSQDEAIGNSTMALINLSTEPRTVALSLTSGHAANYRNLLTGQPVSSTQMMQPYDVLLLKTENPVSPPVVNVIIQWGEVGGDTGIVTNNQSFIFKSITYVGNTNANPVVGADYYPVNTNRSPRFNTAASSNGNAKEISDKDSGDIIRSGKNQATYDCMYVWDLLPDGGTAGLVSLAAEARFSMFGGSGTGTVHWIVQKESGDWYASAGLQLTQYHANAASFPTLSVDEPSGLNWYNFTPLVNGYGSIGSLAIIDMKNVKSVGLYYDLSGSGVNIYADLRYFQAKASSGTSNGWNDYVSAYGLNGDPAADNDDDGKTDLYEYALAGNPTNALNQGTPPSIIYHPDNTVSFQHLEVSNSNPGITYLTEWSDDLVSNVWNRVWDGSNYTESATSGYYDAAYHIDGSTNDNLFFRLHISQP